MTYAKMVYSNFGKYDSEKLLYPQAAKIVQTERHETCFKLTKCSLSYAEIQQKVENQ